MSLIICPECKHEVSSSAVACPNCAHPFARPVVQPRVVVQEFVEEESGFPKWAFIPLGLLGVVLLFVLFAFLRNGDDEAQRNINISLAGQPPASNTTRGTTARTDSPPNQIVVPPSSQSGQIVVPPTTTTSVPSTTTTVPSTETSLPPDKGTVSLEAKVLGRNSTTPQPVRGTRFYLLKKDVESILSDADIEDETGQGSLVTALGLSLVYPDRYGDFNRKAMSAIGKNTAYNVTTDASGKANLKDVKPDNYYLFAVTKSGSGFVVWNSPVTIQAGQNSLVLPPASPTEISQE
ncbi:MAG: hypothetical protein M3R11_12215 [Acidobacteriota bacterium]|nr:hypothetical protein [Acidobacteriota bacterium]